MKHKALILAIAFAGGVSELKAQYDPYGYQYGQRSQPGINFNWNHQSGHTTHEQWNRGPTPIGPPVQTYTPVAPAYQGSRIPTESYYGDSWRSDY